MADATDRAAHRALIDAPAYLVTVAEFAAMRPRSFGLQVWSRPLTKARPPADGLFRDLSAPNAKGELGSTGCSREEAWRSGLASKFEDFR
jgi:hypothetical protein